MTLLLAQVANLQLMHGSMPRIGYLTLIDKYSFMCFMVLFFETAYSTVAGFGGDQEDDCLVTDYTVFRFFASFVIILHLVLIIWFVFRHKEERQKLSMTPSELDNADLGDSELPPAECLWDRSTMLQDKSHSIVTRDLSNDTPKPLISTC